METNRQKEEKEMNYSEAEKAKLLDEVFEPDKEKIADFRRIQNKLAQMTHNDSEPTNPDDEEDDEIPENYDSGAWLASRTPKADKALLRAVQRGNSGAIKIFYQLLNRLVEKQEQTHRFELSAEEHIFIAREADKRIREANLGTSRSPSLSEESPILLDQVCVDNRQEHSPDNQVEAVGLPAESA